MNVNSEAAANWTRAMKAESRVEWLEGENERLRSALKSLLACCEKHPAFQKPSNRITTGRVAAARAALSVQ